MPYIVDVTGRGEPIGRLVRKGSIALVALIALIVVLLMQYRGVFRSSFPAKVLVGDVGDGIGVGADVKLRGVLIGRVASVGLRTLPGSLPMHEIDLSLNPEQAAGVPAGVTARVVPTNVFGAPSLELLDPVAPGSTMLARGAEIPADTSEKTLQLQTVLNQAYGILTSVKPSQINVALTNVAQALQGRGGELGSLITNGDQYLTALNAQRPTFTALLAQLGPSVRSLNDNAPALLDSADNLVQTSKTVFDKRDQLRQTLTEVPGVADDTNELLHHVDGPLLNVLADTHDFGDVLADQYRNIPLSFDALNIAVPLLQAGIKGGLHLSVGLTPFPTYTYADCPRYHDVKGPNCGRSVPPGGQLPPGFPFFEQRPGQVLPTPPNVLGSNGR